MKKILSILFICLFIVGCSSNTIVGKYKIVEVKEGTNVIKGKKLSKMDINFTIKVNSDGTAVLDMGDEVEKLTYDDNYFYSKKDKSDKMAYKYKDKRIEIEEDDMIMIFEK